MNYTTLISAEQLQSLMASKQPLRVFDCSFDLMQPHAGEQQYLASHIPGAVYAHLDKALSARDVRRKVLLFPGVRLHQVKAAVKHAQGLLAGHEGLQLFRGNQGRVVHFLLQSAQCSSAGAWGAARARSTVAAMALRMISAMPVQPIRGILSPNRIRLYSAANTMPEY